MNRVIAIVLSAESGQYKAALATAAGSTKDFEKAVDSAGSSSEKFAKAAKAAGAAIAIILAAVAVAALSMSADFDRAMRNVNSISQVSESQFQRMEQQVLDLSKAVPQSAETLAKGLYDIASSGFQGAAGIQVLDASARAATAGLSDTQTAAQAIVGVLNAYGLSASHAAEVSDVLFQGVNVGVLTFSDLAHGLGDVVGTGAAARVSIQELTGAAAAMTLAGVQPAEAFTSLNRVMQSFIKPSDAMTNLFHNMGYESAFAALQTLGLHGVMEKLRTVTGGNSQALVALFGDIRAARGAFALMSDDGKNYARAFAAVTDQTLVTGATQRAFTEQMKSLSNQWQLFVNNLEAGAIQVGVRVIPALVTGLSGVQTGIADLVDAGQQAGHALTPFLTGLGNSAVSLGHIISDLGSDFAPMVHALGVMAGAGVVGALDAVGASLQTISGFMADNQIVVDALVALYGVKLLASLFAAGGMFETLALKMMYAVDAMGGFTSSVAAAAPILAPLVLLLPLMQISLAGSATHAREAAQATATYTDALKGNTGAVEANIAAATIKNITDSHLFDLIHSAGVDVKLMTQEVMHATPQFKQFAQSIHDAGPGTREFFDAMAAGRNSVDPFIKSLMGLHDAGKLTDGELQVLVGETSGLTEALAVARTKMEAVNAVQQQLGSSTDTTSTSMSGAGQNADFLAEKMQAVADATKAADDAYRASIDPLFGMQKAMMDNAAAQADLAKGGSDLADKQLKVGQTALDVESAAIKLEGAIKAGSVSVGSAKDMLGEWVKQGLMTQSTADELAKKFDDVKAKADQLQGTNILINMTADDSGFQAAVNRALALANQGIQVIIPISGRQGSGVMRWGGAVEHAQSGLVNAGVYNRPTYAFAEPQTGGEAFIPKYGDRARSLQIASIAAGWYGASVVDTMKKGTMQSRSIGSMVGVQRANGTVSAPIVTHIAPQIHLHVTEDVSPMGLARLERAAAHGAETAVKRLTGSGGV